MAKSTEVEVGYNIEELKALLKEEILTELAGKYSDVALDTNEAALAAADKTMKQMLLEQPKRKIMIPEDPLNTNEPVPVCVNGVIFAVPRGIAVDVPESVAEVWEYSYEQTRKANRQLSTVKEITEVEIRE